MLRPQASPAEAGPIPLNDFRAQWAQVREAVHRAVERVGASGWLVLGAEVRAFEEELARRWGVPFCVGCASGLDALEIALRCAGIAPGDPVLTTPLSAFATTLAIVRAGGVPLFVDVDPSGLLDLDRVERALEARPEVRYLMPVHLYGHALDLERLAALRERFGLRVVEDCAQAVGARSRGVPVGTAGDLAATSFYPTKNLGCMGDGGAVLARTLEQAELARSLRDYGQNGKYEHRRLGLNSRLDELQAAILREAFLPELARWTARRAEIAGRYRAGIRSPALRLPPAPEGSESVWHLFPVLVEGSRAAFQEALRGAGVATSIHYPRAIPDQEALRGHPGAEALDPLACAREFCAREVSLPLHPFLGDGEVERVIDACNAWRGTPCTR
jgi:dTDP-3-amino-3,4,6-trideoxy-alpha-D-glucose transaminase